MSTNIVRLELLKKRWHNLNMEIDTTLHELNREKWDSLVLIRGYFWIKSKFHGILCFNFNFWFKNNGKENKWMRPNTVAVLVIFFRKIDSKSTSSQLLRRTLTTEFEKYFTIKDFTYVDQHRCRAYPKTFNLLLYASFSLRQAKFLNFI